MSMWGLVLFMFIFCVVGAVVTIVMYVDMTGDDVEEE